MVYKKKHCFNYESDKSATLDAKNQNFATYIEREKTNINKIKLPHESMGKKLHVWSTQLLQTQKTEGH